MWDCLYIFSRSAAVRIELQGSFRKLAATNYNYFRDYDPSIGRYVESDPIGLRGGINTYGYVYERPLGLIDRFGLKSRVCCRGIPATGNIAGHCYIETQDGKRTTFGLFGGPGTPMASGVGQTFIDNTSFDVGGSCGDWTEDCGTDECVRKTASNYPNPSSYNLGGPNSNTFASTIASKCKLKAPLNPYWTPGWGDAPAPLAPGYSPVPINSPPVPPLPGGPPPDPYSRGGG